MQTQQALGEIRRVKAIEKRAVKAVIEHAVLPEPFRSLMPAANDLRAAAHIRTLEFGAVSEPQLTFAETPATAEGPKA
jgi:hypothetical protein